MNFNEAVDKIMPEINARSNEPFIIYRDKSGDWHSDLTQNQYGERFDWVDDIKEQDPLALEFTGKDFDYETVKNVYDAVLCNRVRAEFYQEKDSGEYSGDSIEAFFEGMDEKEAFSLTCFFTHNVGNLSQNVRDYLTTVEKSFTALKDMCPYNMTANYADQSYNTDLAWETIETIEKAVNDRLEQKTNVDNVRGKSGMTFNEAIYNIMPLVKDGDKSTPFIISRQDGEWIVNYPYPAEKTQKILDEIKKTDPFAVSLTGYDLARGSFPYCYDRILIERLRSEYDNAVFTNTDLSELGALINLLEENIGEFSSEVTDYLSEFDRPLAALYEMKSVRLVSDNPDDDYDYDKIGDFVDAVENEVNDRLHNRKKQEIPAGLEGSEKSDKRNIEGYEEKICIEIAGKHVVLAENPKAAEPYLVCNIKYDNPLNLEERYDGIVTENYVEAMREFVNRVDSSVGQLEAERRESDLPFQTLTAAEYCISDSYKGDYEGKLVVIKPEILAPEYRSAEHQLGLCTGGFGASAEGHGRAVFVKELFSGKAKRYDRTHIAGIADPSKIPNWAIDKLLEYHKKDELNVNASSIESNDKKTIEKAPAIPAKKPTLQEKLENAKEKAREADAAKNDTHGNKPKKRDERE